MYGPLYGPLTTPGPLHIETMAMTARGMTLDVAVTTSQALCPTCTQPSTHIHSDYRRTRADLPWATPFSSGVPSGWQAKKPLSSGTVAALITRVFGRREALQACGEVRGFAERQLFLAGATAHLAAQPPPARYRSPGARPVPHSAPAARRVFGSTAQMFRNRHSIVTNAFRIKA